ncbi:relaxase/mobilization nuclease domain-containing protein [Mucilaginibacter ginsenosidivorans]|uniref:Relaxase n=1 Tax=Mucilaginibacter ginsenosidivorans TaxID=398053 RepID=A0A5B8UW76_9SPHI|nr:relaxase/mobilization nuclease domain-containing protein [Mucilaginibacter ginsenosidivorans]QEC62591.1 relaxase [Mucilaginibacter ginsenosidivorans]
MVAVVHTHKSLRDCLNYNENKVKAGMATCLDAGFYPMDAADMNFHQKLRRLELLTELNQRTKVNTLHVSLNFHPSEKLSDEQLKEIAELFMDKIGFGGQPYLLYQHFDAGHPHIHLLSTNIQADGKAINMHNIGKDKARPACVELEKEYGLVVATDQEKKLGEKFKPINVSRALYGRMETKKAMNTIIHVVTDSYRFSSLAQLNAVLGLYNIVADTGAEGSRVNRHKGLVFRMLDGDGNKVGVPIKASDFASKPILKNLQEKFTRNEALKAGKNKRVAYEVNMAFVRGAKRLSDLQMALREKGIDLLVRQNADGVVYGLTFVDHERKVVFNGSELGKAFSAKAILDRCTNRGADEGKKQNVQRQKRVVQAGQANGGEGREFVPEFLGGDVLKGGLSRFAEELLVDGEQTAGMDAELRRRRRKKKKRVRIAPG